MHVNDEKTPNLYKKLTSTTSMYSKCQQTLPSLLKQIKTKSMIDWIIVITNTIKDQTHTEGKLEETMLQLYHNKTIKSTFNTFNFTSQ